MLGHHCTWAKELSLFVAIVILVQIINAMTSPDGITWTTRTTNNNNGMVLYGLLL
jgi:hypothetical protein